MITLKLAWRNVMRQKTRTWLTISAIAFCAVSILFTMAFARGGHQQLIQASVSVFTGHLQIQEEGYLDDPSLYKAFKAPHEILDELQRDERVGGVAPRIEHGGLITTEEHTTGALIVGIDPAKERKATRLFDKTSKGRPLQQGDRDRVVLGKTLANNLEVAIDDEVQVMAQSFYGSLELRFYKVAGIVDTGTPDFDRTLVVVPIEEMRDLLQMQGLVTNVAVVLESARAKDDLVQKTREMLDGHQAGDLVVVPWEDILPEMVELLFLDNAGAVLYLLILVVVVAFIVLLTITMSVMERVKEFGVLMAMGAKPCRVFMTIMIECMIIGMVGTVLGLLIATGPCWYWSIHPIRFSSMEEAMAAFGMEPEIKTILIPAMYWGAALIMMVITVTASVFPALRAARTRPAEAMRHV